MDKLQMSIFLCLFVTTIAAALTLDHKEGFREKRDVMDSVKDGKDAATKTLGDARAGETGVQVGRPTMKSVIDQIADGTKTV